MNTKRLASVALVPVAFLALSGCGLRAGVAAEVGDSNISTDDVDLLTKVQCIDLASSDAQAAGSSSSAVSLLRMQSLNALIDAKLNDQFTATKDTSYDQDALRKQMTGLATFIKKLPADDRKPVTALIQDLNRGQLKMVTLGDDLLASKGVSKPTDDEALNAAYKERATFEKKLHIRIDPAFAPGKNRVAGTGDRSLSKPVSSFAKQSVSTKPKPAWAEALPPAQKCG